jgi:hypothetical protein
MVADRLRNYVRSFDQRSTAPLAPTRTIAAEQTSPLDKATFSFTAERWALVGSTGEIKAKIHAISFLLERIIEQTGKSNLPPGDQILRSLSAGN